MKKSDFAMIILIASLSVMASYLIVSSIVGSPKGKPVNVKTTELVSSEVVEPSKAVFNKDAINPTVPITIGSTEDVKTTPPPVQETTRTTNQSTNR